MANKRSDAVKGLRLNGCDAQRAEMLVREIGKVRCWLSGFAAGRANGNGLQIGVPGEDSLRQVQQVLNDAISEHIPNGQ